MDRTGRVLPPGRRWPLAALAWIGLGFSAVAAAAIPVSPGTSSEIELAIWQTPAGFATFADTIGLPDSRVARIVPANPGEPAIDRPLPSEGATAQAGLLGFERLPPLPPPETPDLRPDISSGPMLFAPAAAAPTSEAPKSTPPAPLPAAATAVVEKLPVPIPRVERSLHSKPSLPLVGRGVGQDDNRPKVARPPSIVRFPQAETPSSKDDLPKDVAQAPQTDPGDVPAAKEISDGKTDPVRVPVGVAVRPRPAPTHKSPAAAMTPTSTRSRSEDLELVAQEADKHTRSGLEMAGRGAQFAARAEFITALRLIAQGLDSNEVTNDHSRALADALVALRECENFIPGGGRLEADLDLPTIIRTHRTPVLQEAQPEGLTSLDATRQYLTFAQRQFTVAAGHEVAGSMALFALGKLHASLASQPAMHVACAEGKAMVFYQASLLVYPSNYLAANELGVLLARGGRFADARVALEHSVTMTSNRTGWQNLAIVYRRLGENELAKRAERTAQIVEPTSRSRSPQPGSQPVRWIDPDTFAQSFAETPAARQPLPARPTPANTSGPANNPARPAEKRAASRWWPFDNSSSSQMRQ